MDSCASYVGWAEYKQHQWACSEGQGLLQYGALCHTDSPENYQVSSHLNTWWLFSFRCLDLFSSYITPKSSLLQTLCLIDYLSFFHPQTNQSCFSDGAFNVLFLLSFHSFLVYTDTNIGYLAYHKNLGSNFPNTKKMGLKNTMTETSLYNKKNPAYNKVHFAI